MPLKNGYIMAKDVLIGQAMRKSIFIVFAAFLICQGLSHAAPVTDIAVDQAIKDYRAHRYAECMEKLNNLLAQGQNTDKIHYYLALCYQGMSQIATAKGQYLWVYQNSKDPTLRYNSWKAIQDLERWSAHRNYSGNGNNFQRFGTPLRRAPVVANTPLPNPGGPG